MSKIVLPTRARVLEFLADQDHAVHAHEVATRLGVPESSYPGLLRLLDDLVFDGLLQARDGHKFRTASRGKARQKAGEEKRAEAKAAAPDVQARPARETGAQAAIERVRERRPGEKEGILTVNARGFGFVSAEGGDDVYIPGEALGAGLHGDRVVVKIVGRSARGVEGRIVEVVSRGMTRVVGTLRRRGKSAWLEPDDTRVRGPVVLTSDRDTAGAEGNSGTDGQAAVVRITRFPENPNENVEGVLEAVSAPPGSSRSRPRRSSRWPKFASSTSPRRSPRPRATAPTFPRTCSRVARISPGFRPHDRPEGRAGSRRRGVGRTHPERRLPRHRRHRRRVELRAARHGARRRGEAPGVQRVPARSRGAHAPARALVEPLLAPARCAPPLPRGRRGALGER